MRQSWDHPQGRVETLWLDSRVLKNNILGDQTLRQINVYIPAGHDGSNLPLLVDLVGFLSGGPMHTNWRNWGENVPEKADRLIATKQMPPVMIAFPDCFTRLGGNQYINSSAMGLWEDFLIKEMLPFLEQTYSCGGAGKRGVFGKSSGGYGSYFHGMKYGGNVWNAVASHSGDIDFELMFRVDFCHALRRLSDFDGSVERFLATCETALKMKDSDWHTLMLLAQCASYDPDLSQYLGIRLPVDFETCEIIEERWKNWQACDPLHIVEQEEAQNHLNQLKLFYFDCGTLDQYNLVYGSRNLHKKLEKLGIPHIYEEFPDNHSGVDYRMDRSLTLLAHALSQ